MGHAGTAATEPEGFVSEWPTSRTWLEQNGFSLEVRRRCSGQRCRADIEFWRTPSGRLMPLNIVGEGTLMLQPHWQSCPDQQKFRMKPVAEKAPREPKTEKVEAEVPQRRLF